MQTNPKTTYTIFNSNWKGTVKMNKKVITLLLVAAISCSLASCTSKENTDVQGAQTNNPPVQNQETATVLDPDASHYHLITRETPYTIQSKEKDTTYIQCKISEASFVALERANSPCAKEMNQILEHSLKRHNSVKDDLVTMLDSVFSDPEADFEKLAFPWVLETSYELIKNDGKAISLAENVHYFAGGTQPSDTTFVYNFDPETGKQISQVYYDGGDEERDAADDKLYNMLKDKYGEDVITYDYIPSSFTETLTDCWYFTDNGIKINVNAGIIAPYAAGNFELELPKEELAPSAQKYFK